jgi:hypothetical protein
MVDLLSNPSYFNSKFNDKLLLVQPLGLLDKYLYGHQHVLNSWLIFFMVNVNWSHWYGLCALNPWNLVITHHSKLDH